MSVCRTVVFRGTEQKRAKHQRHWRCHGPAAQSVRSPSSRSMTPPTEGGHTVRALPSGFDVGALDHTFVRSPHISAGSEACSSGPRRHPNANTRRPPDAGVALSLSIDAIILASKQFSALDFLPQVLVDSVFLGVRLAVTVAGVATVGYWAARLLRGHDLTLDQAFTAFSFALAPLLL